MNTIFALLIITAIIASVVLFVTRKSGLTLGNMQKIDVSGLKRFFK